MGGSGGFHFGSSSGAGSSRFRNRSGSTGRGNSGDADLRDFVLAFGGIAAIIGVIVTYTMVSSAVSSRQRLVEMIFVLPADPYLPRLDSIMQPGNFASPDNRHALLSRLATIPRPGVVLDSFAVACPRRHSPNQSLLKRAERLYQARMKQAGLKEASSAQVAAARQRDLPLPEGTVCVLGIITTLPRSVRVATQGHDTAAQMLLTSAISVPANNGHPYVLYLYYAPDPGQCLTEWEGRELLQQLARDAPSA